MPVHLIEAMPELVVGLAALAGITGRHWGLRRAGRERPLPARRDLAVRLALAGSWCSVWGLCAAYNWTAQLGVTTLQGTRFYMPAIGTLALLGAWLVIRVPPRAPVAPLASAAVVLVMFGLGFWAFGALRDQPFGGQHRLGGPHGHVERFTAAAAPITCCSASFVLHGIPDAGTAGNVPVSYMM